MSSTSEHAARRRHVKEDLNNHDNQPQDDEGEDEPGVMKIERKVGLSGGISIIVGIVIGSGIFISPKSITRGAGSVGLSLINWIVCGIVSLCGALCYTELGTVIPKSGGEYAYIYHSFGDVLAFLFGWTNIVLMRPASISAVALTCAEYIMVPLFDDGCGTPPDLQVKLTGVAIILFLMALIIYSTSLAVHLQVITTVAKVVALVVIIVGGLVMIAQGNTEHLSTGFEGTETDVGKIVLSIYQGMWAYDGWANLNYITEELKNPNRNLPLSLCIAVPMVIVVYLLTNISYFSVMSVEELLDSPAVAVTWAERVIPAAVWVIPLSVALSTFGGCNGSLFTSGRICFAAAREGHMPQALALVNIHSQCPAPSVILTTIIVIIYTFVGSVTSLIDYLNFARWVFYGITIAGLIYFRFTLPDAPRPIKVPLILPVFVLLTSVFLVVVPIAMQPQLEFLWAALVMLAGLIFYVPFVYLKRSIPGIDKFNIFMELTTKSTLPESIAEHLEQRRNEAKPAATTHKAEQQAQLESSTQL